MTMKLTREEVHVLRRIGIQLRFVGEYKDQAQSSALVPRSAENIMEKEVEELAMVNK